MGSLKNLTLLNLHDNDMLEGACDHFDYFIDDFITDLGGTFAISSFNGTGFSVFSRPYLINLDNATTFDLHEYSATIVFNMTITMYICNKAKNNALGMYDATIAILKQSYTTFERMTFLIAAFNNKAQIYYELCRFDKTKKPLFHHYIYQMQPLWKQCQYTYFDSCRC